ncbi:MAG TPA: ATP-binding protein [Planctomycetota bacterium]|nr:ATP-binding protein [Planctomycetota bacterium]
MGFINVAERTLNAKLVYYGVGVGGKTTSLQQVHGIFCPRNEVQLVSINTEEDSTLLFDFLPINLGQVGGFKIKIQGFTVPGQPKYRQMRKYVLQGADAVVFVVDSQRSRLQENLDSLQSMRQHLRTNSGTSEDIPIVVQYNKRDLPDILSERELDEKFKFRDGIPTFPSVATEGQGVFEAFVEAATLLVEKKVARYGTGREGEDPHAFAEGVREKLWNICDTVRRDRAAVAIDKLPQTRLALRDGTEGAPPSGPLAEHAPRAPRMSLAPLAEGEIELAYELRDSTGASDEAVARKPVFSDEELNHEIAAGAVQFHAPAAEEVDDSLFDKTMLSNLELARRYGELDEQRLLLDRKVHELVEVAQQTVHDLNRPLSAIRLMLSTLAKGYLGQLSEPVHQAVDNGLQAVHQMERLLRDLLDSSRLDSDGIRLTFAECDLTLLLAEVLRTLRYEIEETGVRVLVEPMPCIVADSWALTKVFMNLLGNAIQYGPNDKQAVIQVSCHGGDDEWIVEVRDNGIGIPEKDKPRLFRRFERGSNTGGISGTGLGLHIVKEIVQGHGGSVRFESAVGTGTTFFLHLPKAPRLAPHSVVSETAARADL